jgi:hypothetical protein
VYSALCACIQYLGGSHAVTVTLRNSAVAARRAIAARDGKLREQLMMTSSSKQHGKHSNTSSGKSGNKSTIVGSRSTSSMHNGQATAATVGYNTNSVIANSSSKAEPKYDEYTPTPTAATTPRAR